MKKPGSKSGTKMLTVLEFQTQFGDEQQCGEQLSRQRWPEGFSCPRCGGPSRGYMASRQVHECAGCSYQCSVTAGTIFHKPRVPLTGWFWAIYRLSHDKKGISAMQLKKEIGVSYQTAWLLLHKLRKAMADRDQGYKLGGLIEADEGYVGGRAEGPGRSGRGAESKSVVSWRWSSVALASRARSRFPVSRHWKWSPMPLRPRWRGFSRPRCGPAATFSPTDGRAISD